MSLPAYRWVKVNDRAAFAPRDGAGAIVFKNRMWLLGGWNPWDKVHFPTICNSEVWSSSDGDEWKLEVPRAPWEGRHCAGYVLHQGKMWIVGGDGSHGHYQNDVWNSDDGIWWERVCDNAPWGPRILHYTVVFDNKIWVMGGQTSPAHIPGDEIFYGDVWNTSDGVTWTRVADKLPWAPRGMIGGTAVFQNRIWILGGGTTETPGKPERVLYNDVWSSADGARWEQHTKAAPWHRRAYHEVAVFDDRMWVMEGFDGLDPNYFNRNDVWHSTDGVHWTELPATPWEVRHAASVFVHDDALWIVAGNNMASDVWKLVRVKPDAPPDLRSVETRHPVEIFRMKDGVRYGLIGIRKRYHSPLLLVFANDIEQTLGEAPYIQSGRILMDHGFICAALDLPGHGEDQQPGDDNTIKGWRTRMGNGDPVIPAFVARVSALMDHLVAEGRANPERIAAVGISRGGFMALHAAAADPRIRAVAAIGPISDLCIPFEFHGMERNPMVQSFSLIRQAPRLVDRSVWACIGNNDERNGTPGAVAAIMQIVEEAKARKKQADVEMHVTSAPGHNEDVAATHPLAADWIRRRILATPKI